MKVLFLDIDGVLNSADWYHRRDPEVRKLKDSPSNCALAEIDPAAAARLQRIIDATGCRIVVSSSWRLGYSLTWLTAMLRKGGIVAPVIGATPVGDTGERSDEIERWLSWVPGVEAYVILDDGSDAEMPGHFVHTSWGFGLQDEHVEQAIGILGAAP